MFKLNNKGFSLIELLAAMVILIILFSSIMVSTGAIIRNSNKKAFIINAKAYANALRENSYQDNLSIDEEDSIFFIDPKYLEMDGTNYESPFGEYVVNYLVVTYDGNKFHYFYVAYDDEGWGVRLGKELTNLKKSDVEFLDDDFNEEIFEYKRFNSSNKNCSKLKSYLINVNNSSDPFSDKTNAVFIDKEGNFTTIDLSVC